MSINKVSYYAEVVDKNGATNNLENNNETNKD
jgi:hypothetical protein